jgi:hypothetical protein
MDTPHYKLHSIPNALMISKRGSDFFKVVIDVLTSIGNNDALSPEVATGPILLFFCYLYYTTQEKNEKLVLSLYGKDIFENCSPTFSSKIFVTAPHVLYPINWDNKKHAEYYGKLNKEDPVELFPNSYAVTYWMHSW